MNHEIHEEEKGMERYFFRASAEDFGKIPGSPIAYWVSERVFNLFESAPALGNITKPMIGMRTGDNEKYMRRWFEVEVCQSKYDAKSSLDGKHSGKRWFPYQKGGGFRRWYGNLDFVVNWYDDGFEIKENTLKNYPQLSLNNLGWKISNEKFYFKKGITWTATSSSYFGVRYADAGCLFDVKGSFCIPGDGQINMILSLLCSAFTQSIVKVLNPTIEIQPRDVSSIPFGKNQLVLKKTLIDSTVDRLIDLVRNDWNSYESSWSFTRSPLLYYTVLNTDISVTYKHIRAQWNAYTLEVQNLEMQNNLFIIDAYSLQGELFPEVLLKEITLTCNPHYRYKGNKSDEELEALLLADTIKEFISYAVGCMFGRYALDKPGLILANQGETINDYLKQIPEPSFPADDDNVIPMLDGDWFTDDITERFFKFLRVTFGVKHYEENLKFIELAIGKDIRKYFLKDFYTDHVKRYKKRPIYWLFSSPKGSFNALIYMHRYRPDTVSVILNDYLREFRTKLTSAKNQLEAVSISANASAGEKTKALKEITNLNKKIIELEEYEREVLYPLATEQIEIDLDDGVKVNYNKFGNALKTITGLTVKGN